MTPEPDKRGDKLRAVVDALLSLEATPAEPPPNLETADPPEPSDKRGKDE